MEECHTFAYLPIPSSPHNGELTDLHTGNESNINNNTNNTNYNTNNTNYNDNKIDAHTSADFNSENANVLG